MRGIVNAGAVLNDQHLWRLMLYAKPCGDVVGNVAMLQQVEVKDRDGGVVLPFGFEAAQGHGADGTAGAMLEYDSSPIAIGLLRSIDNVL